jgi:RHS repeat-associated protein
VAGHAWGRERPTKRRSRSTDIRYFSQDQLGSTTALTSSTGATAQSYKYDAYGQLTSTLPTVANPFRYAGQYSDPETGLQYLRARYYDPAAGQMLGRDPLAAETRAPYAYAAGSPLNATDPSGLWLGVDWLPSPGDAITAGADAVATGISQTPAGQLLQLGSSLSGSTLGGCVGGSFTGGGSVSGSVCYIATPSGSSGITATIGGGAGIPISAGGYVGPVVSNGQTLNDQAGPFAYAGGSAGEGPYSGGGQVSRGTNSCGDTIWDVSLGWTPSITLGPPVTLYGGRSQTWVFPGR